MAPEPSADSSADRRGYETNVKFGNVKVSGQGVSNSIGVIKRAYFGLSAQAAAGFSRDLSKRDAVALIDIDPLSWAATLSRLSDYEPLRHQKRLARQRVDGTAEWIVEDLTVREWIASVPGTILWFTGNIGCGKSITCAYFVEYLGLLENIIGYSPICHFIAAHRPGATRQSYVLRSLLKQVLIALDRVSSCPTTLKTRVSKFFHPRAVDKARIADLHDMVLEAFEILPPGYLLIDGLDEMETQSIDSFIRFLYELTDRCSDEKIMVSSRTDLGFNIKIDCKFHLSTPKDVVSHDVSKFIDSKIRAMTRQKRRLTDNEMVLEIVSNNLRDRAKGMFLWVNLQLEALWADCLSEEAETILEILDNLPDDLNLIYERCLQRILPNLKDIAMRAFGWIGNSLRTLTIGECQEVLAVTNKSRPWDGKNKVNKDVILSACTNLVSLDEEDQTLEFVHSSVRQYLFSGHSKIFALGEEECRSMCAIDCVNYLGFPKLAKAYNQQVAITSTSLPSPFAVRSAVAAAVLPRQLLDAFPTAKKQKPLVRLPTQATPINTNYKDVYAFFDYARTYWPTHTAIWNELPPEEVWGTFQNFTLRSELPSECYPWATGDHTASDHRLGLLSYALTNGHWALMMTLIEKVEETELRRLCSVPLSDEGFTALHLAARNKSSWFSDILPLARDINAVDNAGWTALHHAASNDHLGLSQELVKSHEAKLSLLSNDGYSALGLSVASGSYSISELLLDADAIHIGEPNLHPSVIAAKTGNKELVTRFFHDPTYFDPDRRLSRKFSPRPKEVSTQSILLEAAAAAAHSGHLDILKHIMNSRYNIERRIEKHYMNESGVMYLAATEGHTDIIRFLIAKRIHIDHGSFSSLTNKMMEKVVASGYLDVLDELCRLIGANTTSFGNDLNPSQLLALCMLAARNDQPDALEKLVRCSPDNFFERDQQGITILNEACKNGSIRTISFLIRQLGISIDILDPGKDITVYHTLETVHPEIFTKVKDIIERYKLAINNSIKY